MRARSRLFLAAMFCTAAFMWISCGKTDGQSAEPKTRKDRAAEQRKDKAETPLTKIAKEAMDEASIDDEFAAGRQAVEAAGYAVKEYRSFPSQEITKRGRVLIYTDKKGKGSGGVVYLKRTGFNVAPAWHWFFSDMVPDSVVNLEVNHDGLWDVRIVSTKGRAENYVQEESFSLFAKERNDWIAMNGTSSPPLTHDSQMWKIFDGDTATAWRSSVSGPAFVEFDVPFGVAEGNLTICTMDSDQPRSCAIYADGKRVEDIELKPVAGRQAVALGQAVRGARKIRIEFMSAHSNAPAVAVAELGLN